MATRGEGARGRVRSRTRTPTAVTQKSINSPVAQRAKGLEPDGTPTTKNLSLQSEESETIGRDEVHNLHSSRNVLLGKTSPRSASPRSNSSRSSSPRANSRTTRPETNRLGIFEKLEKFRKDSPQREIDEDPPLTKSNSEKVCAPTEMQLTIPNIPKDLPYGKGEADLEKSRKRGRKSQRQGDQLNKNANDPDKESHQVKTDRKKTHEKQATSKSEAVGDEGARKGSPKKKAAKKGLIEVERTYTVNKPPKMQDLPKVMEYVVTRKKYTGVNKAIEQKPPSHNAEDDKTPANSARKCQSQSYPDGSESTMQSVAEIVQENAIPDMKVPKIKKDGSHKKYTGVKKSSEESLGKSTEVGTPSISANESQILLEESESATQLITDTLEENGSSQVKVYTSLTKALQNLPMSGKKPIVTLQKVKMQPSDIRYVIPETALKTEESGSVEEYPISVNDSSTVITQKEEEAIVDKNDSESVSNASSPPEIVVESHINQNSKAPGADSKQMVSRTFSDKMDSLIQSCLKGKMENGAETINGPRCSPRARKQTSIIEDYLASRKSKSSQGAKTDSQGETLGSSGLVFNRSKSRRTYSSNMTPSTNVPSGENGKVEKETEIENLPEEYVRSEKAHKENYFCGTASGSRAKVEDTDPETLAVANPVNHSQASDINFPDEDNMGITLIEEPTEGQLSPENTKKQRPVGHKKVNRRKQLSAGLQKSGAVGQPNARESSVEPERTINEATSSKGKRIPQWKTSQFDPETLQELERLNIDLVLAGTSPMSQTVFDSKSYDSASEIVHNVNPKDLETSSNISVDGNLQNVDAPSKLLSEIFEATNNIDPMSINDINIDLVLTGTMDVKQKKGRPRVVEGNEVLVVSNPSKSNHEGGDEDEVIENLVIQSPVRSRSGRAIKLTSAAIEAGLAHESSMSFLVGSSGAKEKVKSMRCLDFSPERSCSSRDTSPDKGQATSDMKTKGRKRTKKTHVEGSSPTILTPTQNSPSSEKTSLVASSMISSSSNQNATTNPSRDTPKVPGRKKSPPKKRTIREILNITEEDLNVEMPPLAKMHDQNTGAENTPDITHVSERKKEEEDNRVASDSKDEMGIKTSELSQENENKSDKPRIKTDTPQSKVEDEIQKAEENKENMLSVQETDCPSNKQEKLATPLTMNTFKTENQMTDSQRHCEERDEEMAESICSSSKNEKEEIDDYEEYTPVELIEADGKKNQSLFSLISQVTNHMKPESTNLPPIERPPTDDEDDESMLLEGNEPEPEDAQQQENETYSSSSEEEESGSESDASESDEDSEGDDDVNEECSNENESNSSDLEKSEPEKTATEVEELEKDKEMKNAEVEDRCESTEETEKSSGDANVSDEPCAKSNNVDGKEQGMGDIKDSHEDKLKTSVSASEHVSIEGSVMEEKEEVRPSPSSSDVLIEMPLIKGSVKEDVQFCPPSSPPCTSLEKTAKAEENLQNSQPSSPGDFSLEDPEERLRFLAKQLKQLDSFISTDTITKPLPKKEKEQTDGEYRADLSKFKIEEQPPFPEDPKEQKGEQGEFSQTPLPSNTAESSQSACEVSEENPHTIFEKPGPASKKKASAFLSNELDEYLTKNCKLNQKCQGTFMKEVCSPVASDDLVGNSTPDVDMVDDIVFYSFSSQGALEDYTKTGEFPPTPVGTHSTLRKELLEPPVSTTSAANSDDYKTPEKTRDITKIKGWKKKFNPGEEPQVSESQKSEPQMLEPQKTEPQRLSPGRPNGPTVSPTPEGAINSLLKIHWRTKERLLRNLTPDEITILGLSLKQRRRRFKQFTHRKSKKSKTQASEINADNFEGRMRPPIMPPKKRLRPAVLTSSMVMSAMSALRVKPGSRGYPSKCPEEACRFGCICQQSDSSDVTYFDSDEMSSASVDPPPPLPQCGKEYCRLGCLCNLIEEAKGTSSTQDDMQSESWHQDKSSKDTAWKAWVGTKKKVRKRKLQFKEEKPRVEELKDRLIKEEVTGKEEMVQIKKEVKDEKHDTVKLESAFDETSPQMAFQGSYLSMFGLGKKSDIEAAAESKDNEPSGKVRKSSRLKDRTGIGHIDKLQDLIYFDATQWAAIGQKKKVKKEAKSPKQERTNWVTGLGNKHIHLGKQKHSGKPGSPVQRQTSHPELLRVQAPELAGQLQASGGNACSRPILQQPNPIEISSDDEDQAQDDNNEMTMVCARTSIYTAVRKRPLISSKEQYPTNQKPQGQPSIFSKDKAGKDRPSIEKLHNPRNIPPAKLASTSNQPKSTGIRDEKSSEMQVPLKIRKQMVLLQRNHARQAGKDKRPPAKVNEIKPENDDKPPHLLEIQSDCNWQPIRSHLLNQISIIADRDDLPPSGHKLCRRVGDFIVEIRPPSKEPTPLPPNLQTDACKSLLAIRIVITQGNKSTNSSLNTSQDTKNSSPSQAVPKPGPVSQSQRIHTMYPPGSETMANKPQVHPEATSRLTSPAITTPAVTAPMGLSALSKLNISAPGCVKQGEGSLSIQSKARFASFNLASGRFVAGDGGKLYAVAGNKSLDLPKIVESRSNPNGEGPKSNPGLIRLSTNSNLDIQDLSDVLKNASVPTKRKHSLSECSDETSPKYVCITPDNSSGNLLPVEMSVDAEKSTADTSRAKMNNGGEEEACKAYPIEVTESGKNTAGTNTVSPDMNRIMSTPSFMNTVISPPIFTTRPILGAGVRRGPGPRLRMPVVMNVGGRIMGPRGSSCGPRIRIPLSMIKTQTVSAGATPQPITYNLASSAPNKTLKSSQAGPVMVAPVAVRMPLPAEHAITKVNTSSQSDGQNDIPAGSTAPKFIMLDPISSDSECASPAKPSSTTEATEELLPSKLPLALPAQGYTRDIGRQHTDGAESSDSSLEGYSKSGDANQRKCLDTVLVSEDVATDISEASSQMMDTVSASHLRLNVDGDIFSERNESCSSGTKDQDEKIMTTHQSKDKDLQRTSESHATTEISNEENPVVILSDDSEESDVDVMSAEDGQVIAAHQLRGYRDNTREDHLQRMLTFKHRQRPNPALGMMSLELRQHLLKGSQAAHHYRHGSSHNQKVHRLKHIKSNESQEACDDSGTGEDNGSVDGSSRDAHSRKQHLHRERLRRSDLTLKFDKLKAVIPFEYIKSMNINQQSKNAILSGARKYIAYQRRLFTRQEKEREVLLQERVNLIERLKALKYAPHRCLPPASSRHLKLQSIPDSSMSVTPSVSEQQAKQAVKRRAKGQWGPASKRKQFASSSMESSLPVSDTSTRGTPEGSTTSASCSQETTEPSFTITAVRSLATGVSTNIASTPLSSTSSHSSLEEDAEGFLSDAEDDSNDYLSSRSQSTNNDE